MAQCGNLGDKFRNWDCYFVERTGMIIAYVLSVDGMKEHM